MKVYVLCDDTAALSFICEHGLSLYIQTESHRILFDAGQSDTFLKNAEALGVSIADIDTVILSHGHYDHGNGLLHFFQHNSCAKIYMHPNALGAFYHGERYIGLNRGLLGYRDRIVFISTETKIDSEITILPPIDSAWNDTDFAEQIEGAETKDHFNHEIYLEISHASKKALFTGCAHKGIVAIAAMAYQRGVSHLIGGFHLTNEIPLPQLNSIAASLETLPLTYHTGHCTSAEAYGLLSSLLGKRIHRLQSGTCFAIGDHAEVAKFLFRRGYNCSQAVFGAFADELGIDFETAMRLSCSFGGGMGRLREVCGAVSGMLLVCGAKCGYATPETGTVKAKHYRQVQELAKSFRAQHGSIICRDLLGGTVSDSPTPTERTQSFYITRPCERLIASAAYLLEEKIFYNLETDD